MCFPGKVKDATIQFSLGESTPSWHQAPVLKWLIHVNVWQKPLKYCKEISLQLIKINEKTNKQNKTCLPKVSRLYKDTRKTHYTIPWKWEKRSEESILWVLTAIPVVTAIRWNCSERWLPSKKWLAACLIQKIPKLDQSCCFNKEKNETVFSCRFEAAIIQIPCLENIAFNLKAQSKACFFQKTQKIDQSCCNESKNEWVCFSGLLGATTTSFYSGWLLLLPSGPNSQVHKNMFHCNFRAV